MSASQFLELLASLSLQVSLVVIVTHWLGRLADCDQTVCRLWLACHVAIIAMVLSALLLPHPRFFQPWTALDRNSAMAVAQLEQTCGGWLFAVWSAGAAAAVLIFAVQLIRTHAFLSQCRRLDNLPDELEGGAEASAHWSRITEGIDVYTSPNVSSPFCWQLHRPVVVLPEVLMGLNLDDLDRILRHEREHLQSGHPLHLFLQRTVETVFWFHPMIWWASHQAALAREFACDDAAIGEQREIADYLRTLLTVVELGSRRAGAASISLDFGRGPSMIAARARRLAAQAQSRMPQTRGKFGVLSAVVASVSLLLMLIWLPVDVLASARSNWSPWPTWTARALHDFGVSRPDFEPYDRRSALFELREHAIRSR